VSGRSHVSGRSLFFPAFTLRHSSFRSE